MISLAESLLGHSPRETSGSSSANRYEYQRTWALCHLLRLHESGQRYVLILEFHDDVLVLDGDEDPQSAEFFQVKTRRRGSWSKRDLLSAPKPSGKKRGSQTADGITDDVVPRSMLGKLLDHLRHLAPHIKSLNIVSNISFNILLAKAPASSDRDSFPLSELKEEALREVREAIREELGLDEEPPWEKIYLLACGISITEHEKYAVGELAAFLERRCPGGRFAVQPLFRTICGELARRATSEWHPSSFVDLCQKKGIRRADFDGFLRFGEGHIDPEEQLRSVKDQLASEGLSYRDLFDVEQGWRRYDIERRDQANSIVQAFRAQVTQVVGKVSSSGTWKSLREFLGEAEAAFLSGYGPLTAPFDSRYLRGAILLELKTHEARQLQAINSPDPEGSA